MLLECSKLVNVYYKQHKLSCSYSKVTYVFKPLATEHEAYPIAYSIANTFWWYAMKTVRIFHSTQLC